MLEAIISYLTQKVGPVFPEFDVHCLAEIISDGENKFPAVYQGEYKQIDFDSSKGTVYFRRNGSVETSRIDEEFGCDVLETHKIPVRAVLFCKKDIYNTDNAYIDNKVAENLRTALIVNDDRTLRISLKCDAVYVEPQSYTQDKQDILNDEFGGNIPKIGFEYVLVAVDLSINVTGSLSCFEYWSCGDQGSVTFCKLSKVISSDGTTLIDLGPGGLYTVQDSQITNTDNTLLKSLPAEQDYQVQDALIINTNGDVLDLVPAESTGTIGDSLIKDSSGTTLHSVPATQSQTIADATIKDSAGTTIHTVKAEGTQTIADSLIKDSSGTTLHSVKAEQAQTIADTTIYKANGSTVLTTIKAESSKRTDQIIALMSGSEIASDLSTDSLTDDVIQALTAATIYNNMTAAQITAFLKLVTASQLNGALPIATRQKILYVAQLPSGQETSRWTGDAPYYGNLHHRLTDFFTLRNASPLTGRTERFTDDNYNYYSDPITGVKNTPSAYSNGIMIDHATGIMYYLTVLSDTWKNALDACEAFTLTVSGTLRSDWFMPGLMQKFSIARITGAGGDAWNYYPLKPTMANLNMHTATPKNATTNYGINGDGEMFLNTMTTARNYIKARLMTDTELGL